MNRQEAERLAAGYAWAYMDFTGAPVPTGDWGDIDGSFAFSRAYGQAQQDYNEGRRGSFMPVRDAFSAWLATQGTAIEGEWADGEYHFIPLTTAQEA